jgi:hypothetical protein
MILGRTSKGTVPYTLAQDMKLVTRAASPDRLYVPFLRILVDTLGGGGGSQASRPIIYDIEGNIVAAGDELVLPAGLQKDYIDWKFTSLPDGAAILPAAGDYWFGLHGGPSGNVIRVYA